MNVFVKEYCRDVIVRIYGMDGDEHTHEYFEKYLLEVDGIHETTEEEREEYHTEAAFTIEKADHYEFFAQQIDNIQRGIDAAAERIRNGKHIRDYTVDNVCYLI